MATYQNDPRWILAKRAGKDQSGAPFKAGERVFYYPRTGTIIAGDNAETAARDFEAARQDDESMGGSW